MVVMFDQHLLTLNPEGVVTLLFYIEDSVLTFFLNETDD